MPRIFIGKKHDLYGKSLWELLCNLKDLGVGRVVMRTKDNRRFPERSWFTVLRVRPEMDPDNRHGTVTVRKVWRGQEIAGEFALSRTTARTDYQLIPRHEEAQFCQLSPERAAQAVRLLPASLPKPPLLLQLERQWHASSEVSATMPAVYRNNRDYRVVEGVLPSDAASGPA